MLSPVAGKAASSAVKFVVGQFVPLPTHNPDAMPGKALALIRAAYRAAAAET